MKRLIAHYTNGNYKVSLYADGTKVKETEEEAFIPRFPDSIDLKITDRCDRGCPMCHEDSRPDGKHASLDAPFLDSLVGGTELAIGGGNPLCHPGLDGLLERMRERSVICNITVNEGHLPKYRERLLSLRRKGLIHGIGVSVSRANGDTVDFLKSEGVVAHIIAGLVTPPLINKLEGASVLFLGYKKIRRGAEYYSTLIEKRIDWLRGVMPRLLGHFGRVSFDNLAIEQLGVKELLSPERFAECYMGDDGESTMYVDLVRREFARSSTALERFPLLDSAELMLQKIRQ